MAIKFLNTVAVDTNVLYVDAAAHKVGIGTTSPSEKLEIALAVGSSGSDGIFVKGAFAGGPAYGASKNPFISLGTSTDSGYTSTIYLGASATATDQDSKIEFNKSNSALSIYYKGQGTYREHVRFGDPGNSTPKSIFFGNVGIGTTSPSQKLEVAGNILANATNATVNIGSTISTTPGGGHTSTGAGTLIVGGYTNSGYNYQPGVITLINQNPNIGAGADTGVIQFAGKDDATSGYVSANIKAFTTAAAGTGNSGGGIITLGTSPGYGAPIERFRITTSGNVGIGTTSPSEKLDVAGNAIVRGDIVSRDTYPSIYVDHSGTVMGGIRADGTNKLELKTLTTAPLSFQVNNSEKMRILSSGNVGIGTTSPSELLHLFSTSGGTMFALEGNNPEILLDDNNGDNVYIRNTGGDLAFKKTDGSSVNMTIEQGGNVGIGTTSPSVKLQVEGDGIFNGSVIINKNAETLRLGTTEASGGTYQTWHNASGIKGFFGYGSTVNDIISLVNEENSTIQLGTNGRTADFIVSADGNIGLGITSPGVKLVTIAQNYSEGPTLGSGVVGGQALLATNGLFGQYSGVSATTGHVWHQVQRNDATTAYNMILQPSGGNVGIGTTSPDRPLSVVGGNSMVARFQSTNTTSFIQFSNTVSTADQVRIGSNGTNLVLSTNYAERMRITSAGDTGIGVTTPRAKLDVAGGVKVADDTDTASANKVGTLRYRYVPGSPKNYSYVDMCMQTGASSYAWVNIVQNVW